MRLLVAAVRTRVESAYIVGDEDAYIDDDEGLRSRAEQQRVTALPMEPAGRYSRRSADGCVEETRRGNRVAAL